MPLPRRCHRLTSGRALGVQTAACYRFIVPVRHALLGLLAAFVVIAGVYLFVQVRSTPSAVAASASPPPRHLDPAADPPDRAPTPATDHRAAATHQAPVTNPTMAAEPSSGSDEDPTIALERPDVKVDAIMARANSAYDKGDWDEAKMVAGKVLAKQPTNIRMMRIMVSASCIDGDSVMAQQWFEKLPKGDREQMKTRCDRYGVSFKEPAQ